MVETPFDLLLDRLLDGSLPFAFHYQPIVDLRRGVTVGYEALARFPAEIGLTPDKCFQAAAQCGRLLELEELAAGLALRERDRLPPNCFLSVNMSPGFLLSERWVAMLAALDSLDRVVIEVTEKALISDYDKIRGKLAAIRARGGHIAVDDTGSGYASLRHVMELRPQFVKLDRFFVGGCDADRNKAALVEMIGNAAGRLDAWIIAEGIETAAELEELIRLGVPLGQGYFLGMPIPEMTPIPAERASTFAQRAQTLLDRGSILSHSEVCTPCGNEGEAQKRLEECLEVDFAVVVDRWGRPVAMLERHPLLGVRSLPRWMCVQSSSEAADVLYRAITRDAATRFDSLLVTNELGRFEGVLRIDRLMRSVLDARATAGQSGSPVAGQR